MRSLTDIAASVLAQEESWHQSGSSLTGYSTGFPSLDYFTGGFNKGQEYVLGARTSHGKTLYAIEAMFAVAKQVLRQAYEDRERRSKRILCFSPEMTDEQLVMRYVSSAVGVPFRRLARREATPEERQRWRRGVEIVVKYDPFLHLSAGSSMEITDLYLATESAHREREIALLVVDYIQRIDGRGKTPYEKATDVSRRLKDLTNTLNIPVLALSQCHRPDDSSIRRRPYMHELRDSGSIEQDSDVVIMAWRPPSLLHQELRHGSSALMYVDKSRHLGETGWFPLVYDPVRHRVLDTGQEIHIDGE